MNRMGKRAFVLAIAMLVLVALPVLAMADAATVANLADLQTALSQGKNPITLTGKIEINQDVILAGSGTITTNIIDAFTVTNGATLTIKTDITSSVGAILYADNGTIIIDGGSELKATKNNTKNWCLAYADQGGTIVVENGELKGENGAVVTLDVAGGKAVINKNGKVYSKDCSAVASSGDGSVIEINGGTVVSESDNQYDAAAFATAGKIIMNNGTVEAKTFMGIYASNNGSAEINGGTVTVKSGKYAAAGTDGKTAKMLITGGNFSDASVEKYVASGLTVEKKDGKWHVVKIASADVVTNWDAPETGDKENLMLWVALMAMACMGLMVCRKTREN